MKVWQINTSGDLVQREYEKETNSFFVNLYGNRDSKETSYEKRSTVKQECIDWCISTSQNKLNSAKARFDYVSEQHNKLIQKILVNEEQK